MSSVPASLRDTRGHKLPKTIFALVTYHRITKVMAVLVPEASLSSVLFPLVARGRIYFVGITL